MNTLFTSRKTDNLFIYLFNEGQLICINGFISVMVFKKVSMLSVVDIRGGDPPTFCDKRNLQNIPLKDIAFCHILLSTP